MSRYRKPRKQIDLSQLQPDSKEYWEEILRREGLGMDRGKYPARLTYGWEYRDSDGHNRGENKPENKPLAASTNGGDDYSEESKP